MYEYMYDFNLIIHYMYLLSKYIEAHKNDKLLLLNRFKY